MPEKNMTPSVTSGNVGELSSEVLTASLADHSVTEVKKLLDDIIADNSLSRKGRRNLVNHVVTSQSYPTNQFTEYDDHNAAFNRRIDSDDKAGISGCSFAGVSMFATSSVIEDGVYLIATLGLFMILLGVVTFYFTTIPHKNHKEAYGIRSSVSLEEIEAQETEAKRNQIAALTAELGGDNGATVSLSTVKQDYADALARVASYETDFDKALRYPAFNDVTVEETATMVKHMRTCRHHADSGDAVDSAVFKSAVDELWVAVLAAERRAKKIALTGVTDEERKGLEHAQKLLVQIRDHGNTEELRATLYDQLRRVVNRINATDDVVPTKIVAEIETKAALGIETGKVDKTNTKEPEHV